MPSCSRPRKGETDNAPRAIIESCQGLWKKATAKMERLSDYNLLLCHSSDNEGSATASDEENDYY